MNPGWVESRLGALESRVEYLVRYLQDLLPQLRSAQQSARTANQQYPYTSVGSGGGTFFCQPSGTVSGASGTWPSITPVSFTANVYQGTAGSLTLVTSSATIWNYCAASLVASKTCPVIADGSGAYAVYTQSCT